MTPKKKEMETLLSAAKKKFAENYNNLPFEVRKSLSDMLARHREICLILTMVENFRKKIIDRKRIIERSLIEDYKEQYKEE